MDLPPSNLKEGCLLVLKYFGIFKYPLMPEEIHLFHPLTSSLDDIRDALDELLGEESVAKSGLFFMLNEDEKWVSGRLKNNESACSLLAKSGRYASVIASFPFVRCIAISGSLSKFSISGTPDIDYFIITAPGRLWIARTLLHLFKKLTFITGHQHYYCMNYFIDTNALAITHPNRYTAIETVTLLPVYNAKLLALFFDENQWVKDYLPNHPGPVNLSYLVKDKNQPLKKLTEGILNLCFPGKINAMLMRLTDRKWRRKWKRAGYPGSEYDRAFMTTIHISKNHPVDYEKKVLSAIEETSIPEI